MIFVVFRSFEVTILDFSYIIHFQMLCPVLVEVSQLDMYWFE